MNSILLALAIITGPFPDAPPNLQFKIHIGRGRESQIIRSELARPDVWFLSHRVAVEAHFRIVIVDDLYRSRPCYQIGRGDDRHDFPPGTFAASGSFMRTLRSLAAIDRWEREFPSGSYYQLNGEYHMGRDPATRPEVFPPQPTPPPTDNPMPDEVPIPTFEAPEVP